MTAGSGYLYLPDGWDSGWKAAKDLNPRPSVAMIGDSISVGVSGAGYTGCFSEQVYRMLVAQLGSSADYYAAQMGYLGGDTNGGPWSTLQNGATLTRYTGSSGWMGFLYSNLLTAVASQTFTTPYPCTALDIIYWDSFAAAASTWGYQIDGGATQTVTNGATNTIKKISISGLPYAIHTVAWGWQSANAAAAMQGIVTYRSPASAGLLFARHNASGAGIADIAGTYWNGQNFSWPAVFPIAPHLALIDLVTNDINNNVTIANFTKGVHQLIRALRRAQPNCSLLWLVPSYPDHTIDDVNTGFANDAVAYTYHVELLRLAQLYGFGLVNFHTKWGSTPYGAGLLPNNDVHPTAAGQADIFATIAPLL